MIPPGTHEELCLLASNSRKTLKKYQRGIGYG